MATSHPSTDQSILVSPRVQASPWVVLLVLTLGFFMILLDTTIVNIAMPAMEKGLNAGFDEILWVLNSYTLVYAVLLITAARLGDMFGPKRLFILGLVLFTAASVACGLSQTATQLIVFRIIQAVGGAILTPQTLSMLPRIFPPEKRGAAFGVWAGVSGLAAVMGPTLGGFLVTNFDWQSIFFVNVPVGLFAIAAAFLLMPELRLAARHNLDVLGVVLASSGLFLLIFALIEGQKYSWGPIASVLQFWIGPMHWALLSVYSLLVYAIALLALFLWHEARTDEPLLPLSLFHDRNFSVSNLTTSMVTFTMAGYFIPMTIFLQSVRGFSALHAGLILLPTSLGLLIASPISGRLSDKVNGKYLVIFGMLCASSGMALVLHVISLTMSPWDVFLPALLMGLGMGCTFAPLTTLAMRDIGSDMSGAASGFLTTLRQVTMAIGSAVLGAVLIRQVSTELPGQVAKAANGLAPRYRRDLYNSFQSAAHDSQQFGAGQVRFQGVHHVSQPVLVQLTQAAQSAFGHAFVNAMRPTLLVPIAALFLGACFATMMRGGRSAAASRRPTEAVAVREAAVSTKPAKAS